MGNKNYIIGIDPDVDKIGIAQVCNKRLEFVNTLSFLDIMKYLERIKDVDAEVIIEAGWLISHNWHINPCDSKAVISAKGKAIGRCEEISRKIGEICEYFGIKHQFIKPLKKCWAGQDRKITAQEFKDITSWEKRTNQESRDAGLIAWVYAGLPIVISKRKR